MLWLAQGFTRQRHLMRRMQHPIQNGVGERRIIQIGMPMLRRQLTGNQGRTGGDAIIEHFQQIVALDLIERCQPPVIKNQ